MSWFSFFCDGSVRILYPHQCRRFRKSPRISKVSTYGVSHGTSFGEPIGVKFPPQLSENRVLSFYKKIKIPIKRQNEENTICVNNETKEANSKGYTHRR